MKLFNYLAGSIGIAALIMALAGPVHAASTKETKDSPLFSETLDRSVKRMDAAETLLAALGVFTMDSESTLCEAKETLDAEDEACKEEGEDIGPPEEVLPDASGYTTDPENPMCEIKETLDAEDPECSSATGEEDEENDLPRILATFDGFSGILAIPCLKIPGVGSCFMELKVEDWQEKTFRISFDNLKKSPLDNTDCAVVDPETYAISIPFVKTGGAAYYMEMELIDQANHIFKLRRVNPRENPPDLPDTMNPMNSRCEFAETMDPMDIDCADNSQNPGEETGSSPEDIRTRIIMPNDSVPVTLSSQSHVQVFGSANTNVVNIEAGARVQLMNFAGSNEINMDEGFSEFTVYRSGATVNLSSNAGTSIQIAATLTNQTLRFAGNSLELVITGGNVMLGNQIIE
ncbi:MAG: hypothetical protein GY737_19830 [Desulfobacteraceae bacterium]|nr:hypothetical protein [Desulfobacteraceae bacterium]